MTCLRILLLLLLLSPIACADFAGSQAYFTRNVLYSKIVLNDFSISSTTITVGSTADFSVTFENTGTASTTATARVYIFDASDTLVDTVNYSPVGIAPNQQITQQKTWDSDGLPVGSYTAKANVTYNPGNETNGTSNELSLSFAIVSGGGTQGGGPGLEEGPVILPIPIEELPPLAPKMEGPVEFIRFPVLKEIVAGQSTVQDVALINKGDKELMVSLEVTGIEAGWLRMSAPQTKMLPGETRNIDLAVNVPADAQPGNYLLRVDAKNEEGESADFMVVRVKGVSRSRTMPVILRTIEVDRVDKETTVTVSVSNPAPKDLQHISFTDTLPEELGGKSITFQDRPGEVKSENGRKNLEWDFLELLSKEQLSISYVLGGVLDQYSPYVNWYAYELDITQRVDLSELVQILDLSAGAMEAGGTGQVTATVLYVGEKPLPVTMSLEVPAGFTVEPNYLTVTLQPRNTFTARFDVGVPEDVQESQLVRFLLFTDDGQVSARLPIVVPRVVVAPPAAAALSIKPMDVAMGGLLAVAFIFAYMFYRRRKEGGGVSFDKERLEYARSLRKLVKIEQE